jgi:hypothetical protein
MADIALVHLGIDSSGVVAGEKQATRSLQNISSSADKATQTLSNMGGPVGRLASSFGNLTGSASTLVGGLGLLGGAAAAAVTAIAALGAALISAAIDGGKLADEIVDLAGLTGVSVETLEKLQTGYVGVGGSAQDARGSISRFSASLGEAASGNAPKLEKALKALGVVDFTDVDRSLKAVLGTLSQNKNVTETNAVALQLLGKEGGRMVNVWRDLDDSGSELNQTLAKFGLTLDAGVLQTAAKVGDELDLMSLAFDQLKIKIAAELMPTIVNFGTTFLQIFKNLEPVILATARLLEAVLTPLTSALSIRGLPQQRTTTNIGGQEVEILPGKSLSIGGSGQAAAGLSATGKALQELLREEKKQRAPAAGKGISLPFAAFTFDQALQALGKGMKETEERAEGVANGLAAMNARLLEILGARAELIRQGVPLPLAGGMIQQGGPGQPSPGAPIFRGLPPPSTIRTEEQARLDEQFSAIFDDFFVTILTAQNTLGGAFAGLALGIADTFAIELTKAMRESFITPMVRGLTELLQEGLQSLFGGLSGFGGGGVKGFFGGLLKGIGTIFGGFFATGGTLGPGKFGIAGERGPELLFSGNQPLHIAPVSNVGGSGVMSVNMNFAIATPTGEVSQRTQDQIADSAMRGLERAQRLRGAR